MAVFFENAILIVACCFAFKNRYKGKRFISGLHLGNRIIANEHNLQPYEDIIYDDIILSKKLENLENFVLMV